MVVSRAEQAMMSALCLAGGFNVFGRGHAVAEVDDVEALGFHHHADKVLADVVEVVLDGADDDGALFFHLVAHEEGTQDIGSGGHRAGGDEHFGDEDVVFLEAFADDVHARA